MKENDEQGPVVAYAGTPWHAALLKSMLEDAGIESFLKDENISVIAPWLAGAGGFGTTVVMVAQEDLETAEAIVEDFQENLLKPDEDFGD